ncbi:MAG: NAD-glutamate dehydrogenase, partial [Pseudomonadota bacterium]
MSVQDHPRGESAGYSLIGAAAAVLGLREPGIPENFLARLFGLALPKDLTRFGPEELATIAAQSWAVFAQRSPGALQLRLAPAASPRGVSVLDIVNDDMPFLLDSVLGELNERGLKISLLAHPVFAVERDEAGRLIYFEGARKDGGKQESFIHIHIEGLEDAAQRADIICALEDILAQVRICVQDWEPMLARARE